MAILSESVSISFKNLSSMKVLLCLIDQHKSQTLPQGFDFGLPSKYMCAEKKPKSPFPALKRSFILYLCEREPRWSQQNKLANGQEETHNPSNIFSENREDVWTLAATLPISKLSQSGVNHCPFYLKAFGLKQNSSTLVVYGCLGLNGCQTCSRVAQSVLNTIRFRHGFGLTFTHFSQPLTKPHWGCTDPGCSWS